MGKLSLKPKTIPKKESSSDLGSSTMSENSARVNQAQILQRNLHALLVKSIAEKNNKETAKLLRQLSINTESCRYFIDKALQVGNYEAIELMLEIADQSHFKEGFFISLFTKAARNNDEKLLEAIKQKCPKHQTPKDIPLIFYAAQNNSSAFKQWQEFGKVRWQIILEVAAQNNHQDIFNLAFQMIPEDQKRRINWLDVAYCATKSDKVEMLDLALDKFEEIQPNVRATVNWINIALVAVKNQTPAMLDEIFTKIPDKLTILEASLDSSDPEILVKTFCQFIDRFDEIFLEVSDDKKQEFLEDLSSKISQMPDHIESVQLLGIVQKLDLKIQNNPNVGEIKLEFDQDRFESLASLASLQKTNKRFYDIISQKPATTFSKPQLAENDYLGKAPDDVLGMVISYI